MRVNGFVVLVVRSETEFSLSEHVIFGSNQRRQWTGPAYKSGVMLLLYSLDCSTRGSSNEHPAIAHRRRTQARVAEEAASSFFLGQVYPLFEMRDDGQGQ